MYRYAILITVLALSALTYAGATVVPYHAKVEYLAMVTTEEVFTIPPGGSVEIGKPGLAPAPGYELREIIVELDKVYPTISITADGTVFRGEVDGGGTRLIVLPDAHRIVISNSGKGTVEVTARISRVFSRTEYVELVEGQVNRITIRWPDPPLVGKGVDAAVKLSIDNYAPFSIIGVVDGGGRPMHEVDGAKFRVEPKMLAIEEAPTGNYVVMVAYGDDRRLPSAMLVKSLDETPISVNPKGTIEVSGSEVGLPAGWNLLGYVVLVHTARIGVRGEKDIGGVKIEGGLVDPVDASSSSRIIRSVSYLVPPVWTYTSFTRVAIVYGHSFRIVNEMDVPAAAMYIPLVYKPAQVFWSDKGATVSVGLEDLAFGKWTSIVMRLPEVAKILDIETPSGVRVSATTDAKWPWGTYFRFVGISSDGDEAYVIVHMGDNREPGNYTFALEWSPITLVLPRDINGIDVVVNGSVIPVVDGEAKIHVNRPGEARAIVRFRGVQIGEVLIKGLVAAPIDAGVKVGEVKVRVVGARSQPIPGAEVRLMLGDVVVAEAYTDELGVATFKNVVSGKYKVLVLSGDRVAGWSDISVMGNGEFTVGTDILATLGGYHLSTDHMKIALLGLLAGATMLGFTRAVKRRRAGVRVETF